MPAGNALVEGATFIAILLGTVGGIFAASTDVHLHLVAAAIVAFALLSWSAARMIPATGSAAPDLTIDTNIARSTRHLLTDLKSDRRIWQGALITSWFWLVGAVILAPLQALIPRLINGEPTVYTLALFTFAIAAGAGSITAARASSNRPNLALVPIGALLMGLFSLDLAFLAATLAPSPTPVGPLKVLSTFPGLRLMIDLGGVAFAGGLYSCRHLPPCRRGRVSIDALASSPAAISYPQHL